MEPIHVIYHKGCVDGFTSLWVASVAFGKERIVAHGGRRGDVPGSDEIPDGSNVIIADFSFSKEQTETLAARSQSLAIFDHHETARADLEDLPYAVFDMDRSGASITWDSLIGRAAVTADGTMPIAIDGDLHFTPANPDTGRPWLVDYVEDRDLWNFALPNSEEVGAFTQTLEHDLTVWDETALLSVEQMVTQGQGASAMRKSFVRQVMSNGYMCQMGDRAFPIVNVSYPVGSETAQGLMEHFGTDMAAYYFYRSDGGVQYGFRGRNGTTVHDFAESFGGGGHPSASGCMASKPLHVMI